MIRLSKKMLCVWYQNVPVVTGIPPQPINIAAMKAFFSAIKETVAWAALAQLNVTQSVQDAWSAGTEEAEIMAKLELAESAGGGRGRQKK